MPAAAPATLGLVAPDGRPISARDIAAVRARAALSGPANNGFAYDASAIISQEMAGWLPWLRSPDSEINRDRDRVVARARDLIRNDGWASGAVNRILDAAIGAQFHPIPAPNFRVLARHDPAFDATWAAEFAAQARAEWSLWADDPNRYCDAGQRLTVTQMLRLALRHKLIDGDSLVMCVWAPDQIGYGAARYATALQVIDPDRLSNPYEQLDTATLRGGIEIDAADAPVAYHVRRAHQNDPYDAAEAMQWDRIPRRTAWGRPIIVHDCDQDRTGQNRGTGILTAVLSRFKMLTKFDAVSLQAAVLRTLVGFFVKSPYDQEQVFQALDTGGESLGFYQDLRAIYGERCPPVMGGVGIPKLFPGESIETISAGEHATDFEGFQHAFLRSVAAATGQSTEEVTGDFRQVNYSSFRGAALQAWRTLLRRRHDFAAGTATPIYGAWLEEAMDADRLPLPRNAPPFVELRAAYARCRWIGPGRGWVDPVKERQGEVMGLQAGFGTLDQTCADISGTYWLDQLDEREVEEAEMRRRGLRLPDWAGGEDARDVDRKPMPV